MTDAVEGLLGFKADQFRQVVLLPQGDFRKLLLAGSGERQQIMQTLFHTQRYARLQELAKARHDALASQYEQVRQRREQCLAALDIADEKELPAKERQWQDQAVAVDKQWQEAEGTRKTCQAAFQAAQALDAHWLLRDQKRREAAQLQAQARQFQERGIPSPSCARLKSWPNPAATWTTWKERAGRPIKPLKKRVNWLKGPRKT